MAEAPSGLAQSLRRKLDEGRTPEELIQELIAGGLSSTTAQRFVERALADSDPPPSPDADQSPPIDDPDSIDRPRSWNRVLAAVAVPAAIILAVAGYLGWLRFEERREAQNVAAARLAAADAARSSEIRAESLTKRQAANRERSQRQDERLTQALSQLTATLGDSRCEGAMTLGRSGSREHVGPLAAAFTAETSPNLRVCLMGALVQLGETEMAMAWFTEWAASTNPDLYRAALAGFGDIGPDAAEVALPILTEALKSPHWDQRYVVVESLSKLGPAAAPLLEVAAGDADKNVREHAARALKKDPIRN